MFWLLKRKKGKNEENKFSKANNASEVKRCLFSKQLFIVDLHAVRICISIFKLMTSGACFVPHSPFNVTCTLATPTNHASHAHTPNLASRLLQSAARQSERSGWASHLSLGKGHRSRRPHIESPLGSQRWWRNNATPYHRSERKKETESFTISALFLFSIFASESRKF